MNRAEALKIGKIIADRWWVRNQSTIRAKQNIERRKLWEQKKLTTPASKSKSSKVNLFDLIIAEEKRFYQ